MEQEPQNPKHLPEGKTAIAFRDVSFHYLLERPLIEHFNLDVQPVSVLRLSADGCGKTTLINLLMRFYDVVDGSITVGGVDIRNVPRDELRGRFGMVLQETWLTQATVAENIGYGKPGATGKRLSLLPRPHMRTASFVASLKATIL